MFSNPQRPSATKDSVMRILIADSDVALLISLQSDFKKAGHQAEIVRDGAECLAMLDDFIPDVVILAGDLPTEGCDPILTFMWNNPGLSHVPVVVLTANLQPTFDGLRHHNATAWLQKPF